ncbi:ferritin-like domain-containing protein [Halobellus salinisoli]|uniref:ferritin-like domain-containing protein n=1 Tax=Halobellus salinisoli TaxID=3108500 RepID=UPI003CE4E72A
MGLRRGPRRRAYTGGDDPVSEAQYNFDVANVDRSLATARSFEKTGVGAYTGGGRFLESSDLVRDAVSIHSVETNHWSLLNDSNRGSKIPNAFNFPSHRTKFSKWSVQTFKREIKTPNKAQPSNT